MKFLKYLSTVTYSLQVYQFDCLNRPKRLEYRKLLFNLSFFNVSIFYRQQIFLKKKKICVVENGCLNSWFSLAYSKSSWTGYTGLKSSEATGFIMVFAVILNISDFSLFSM